MGENNRQRYIPLGMKSSWMNIQRTATFGSPMSLIVQKHLVEDTNLYNRYFRSIYDQICSHAFHILVNNSFQFHQINLCELYQTRGS